MICCNLKTGLFDHSQHLKLFWLTPTTPTCKQHVKNPHQQILIIQLEGTVHYSLFLRVYSFCAVCILSSPKSLSVSCLLFSPYTIIFNLLLKNYFYSKTKPNLMLTFTCFLPCPITPSLCIHDKPLLIFSKSV